MTSEDGRSGQTRAFLLDNVVVLAATTLTRLRGLLTLPLLVRGLGTDAYGVWSLVLATSMVLGTVVGLNLHHSLVQFVASAQKKAGVTYGSLLAATVVFSSVALVPLALFSGEGLRRLAIGSADRSYFWLALGLTFTITLRTLNSNLYRATNRFRARTIFDLSSSLIELVGILVLLAYGRPLVDVLLFMLFASALFVVATTIHGSVTVGMGPPDLGIIRDAVRYGVPLIPASLGAFALDRGDRFVISRFLGEHEVGIYSAQCAIGSLISMLILPLQATLVPKVSQLWKTDPAGARNYLATSFRFLAAVAVLFVAGVAMLAPPLFRHIANDEIAATASVNATLVAVGFGCWGFTIVEMTVPLAARRTKIIGLVMGAGAALNFALNWVFVPRFGVVAAAAATAATYLATFACLGIANRSTLRFAHNPMSVARAILAAVPFVLVAEAIKPVRLPTIVAVAVLGTVVFAAAFVVLGGVTPPERAVAIGWIRAFARRERDL